MFKIVIATLSTTQNESRNVNVLLKGGLNKYPHPSHLAILDSNFWCWVFSLGSEEKLEKHYKGPTLQYCESTILQSKEIKLKAKDKICCCGTTEAVTRFPITLSFTEDMKAILPLLRIS